MGIKMVFKTNTIMRQSGTEASRQRDKLRHGVWAGVRARCLVTLCLLIVLLSAADSFAEDLQASSKDAGLFVTVSSEVQVTGGRILLGQVAEISGGIQAIREKLSGLDLGAAPRPGKERRVPGRLVASTLDSSGWLPAGTRTKIPDWLIVKGACQTISHASLEGVFKAYIDRRTGGDEAAVSNVKIRGVKPLPLGDIALTPLGHGGEYIKGRAILRLAVTVAGEDQGQISISGWVDRYAQAVRTTRSIQRGTVFTAGDVCLKRVNVSKAPNRIVFDMDQVLGKQVRSRIQAGEFIRENMLTTPPLIEKGDRVKILAKAGRLSVSAIGIAKSDGVKGSQIRVENIVSEKTVVGRVMDGNTVEVLF